MKKYTKKYNKNNETLSFSFVGEEKKGIEVDKTKIDNLLDYCFFNARFSFVDLTKVISWIRTILRDYDESYLQVNAIDEKLKDETTDEGIYIWKRSAEYINKDLSFYSINNKVCLDKKNNIFQPFSPNIFRSSGFIYGYDSLKEDMVDIGVLEKVNEVKLNKDDLEACEYYKYFYGDYPDFTDLTINYKLYMLYRFSILFLWSIHINESTSFYSLMPYGKLENTGVELDLQDSEKKEMKILGEVVKDLSKEKMEQLHDLMLSIMQFGKYDARYSSRPQFQAYSIDDREKVIQLIDKVRTGYIKG